jgi:tRNA(fMet)-specific endonuclease VapC
VVDRLILDTGVIVAAERRHLELRTVIGDHDPAISAITAMELLVGVGRTQPKYRDMIALNAEAWLAIMPVENHTVHVARAHAHLATHTRRTGRPRGPIDLVVAATACATGRTLITTDSAAAFHDLPGVRAEVVRVNRPRPGDRRR